MDDVERKKNYNCDVTYGTNNEFGFDYLRDNMKYNIEEMVQRDHFYCIVDEVDSILIDEARTPLVISGSTEDKSDQYFVCNKFVKQLNKDDYELDEKNKNVMLSEKGIDSIEKISKTYGILKNNNFYDPQNINLVHHINQALKANLLFFKDTDYIVIDNKIQLIDEFTGRVLEGRRFSDGLHQALEAKETREGLEAIRERQYSSPLNEMYYAGGGIAGIRRPWAIPPASGPMPQGGRLSSQFNRVKKLTE